MTLALYTLIHIVRILLDVLFFLMFIRAILSWLPVDEESFIVRFVYTITEPVITPFRILTDRISAFQMLPIDIAYFMAFIALAILQMLLELIPFPFN